jgi:hypothetical protein
MRLARFILCNVNFKAFHSRVKGAITVTLTFQSDRARGGRFPLLGLIAVASDFEPDVDSNREKFRCTFEGDIVRWTPIVNALGLKLGWASPRGRSQSRARCAHKRSAAYQRGRANLPDAW